MERSKEKSPVAEVSGDDLRDGWDRADDTPGGYGKVKGVRGSVPQGIIALELEKRVKPPRQRRSTVDVSRRTQQEFTDQLMEKRMGFRWDRR